MVGARLKRDGLGVDHGRGPEEAQGVPSGQP